MYIYRGIQFKFLRKRFISTPPITCLGSDIPILASHHMLGFWCSDSCLPSHAWVLMFRFLLPMAITCLGSDVPILASHHILGFWYSHSCLPSHAWVLIFPFFPPITCLGYDVSHSCFPWPSHAWVLVFPFLPPITCLGSDNPILLMQKKHEPINWGT